MDPEVRGELISAYLDGELTPEERADVERCLAEDPACRQLYEELRAMRGAFEALPQFNLGDDFASGILAAAERRMLAQQEPTSNSSDESPTAAQQTSHETSQNESSKANDVPATSRNSRDLWWRAGLWMAAAASLLAIVGLPSWYLADSNRNREVTLARTEAPADAVVAISLGSQEDSFAAAPETRSISGDADARRWAMRNRSGSTDDVALQYSGPTAAPQRTVSASDMPANSIAPNNSTANNSAALGVDLLKRKAVERGERQNSASASGVASMSAGLNDTQINGNVVNSDAGTQGRLKNAEADWVGDPTARTKASGGQILDIAQAHGASDLLVVHVDISDAAWREGSFSNLLDRNGIAWEDPSMKYGVAERLAVDTDGDADRKLGDLADSGGRPRSELRSDSASSRETAKETPDQPAPAPPQPTADATATFDLGQPEGRRYADGYQYAAFNGTVPTVYVEATEQQIESLLADLKHDQGRDYLSVAVVPAPGASFQQGWGSTYSRGFAVQTEKQTQPDFFTKQTPSAYAAQPGLSGGGFGAAAASAPDELSAAKATSDNRTVDKPVAGDIPQPVVPLDGKVETGAAEANGTAKAIGNVEEKSDKSVPKNDSSNSVQDAPDDKKAEQVRAESLPGGNTANRPENASDEGSPSSGETASPDGNGNEQQRRGAALLMQMVPPRSSKLNDEETAKDESGQAVNRDSSQRDQGIQQRGLANTAPAQGNKPQPLVEGPTDGIRHARPLSETETADLRESLEVLQRAQGKLAEPPPARSDARALFVFRVLSPNPRMPVAGPSTNASALQAPSTQRPVESAPTPSSAPADSPAPDKP